MARCSTDGRSTRGATVLLAGLAVIAASFVDAAAPAPAFAFTSCGPTASTCQPAAADDTYDAVFNRKLAVAAPGLLANDSGPNSTIVDVADSDTQSMGGATVVVHSNGSFSYTPDPSSPFSGIDSFEYWIQDGADDTDFATVTINVPAVVNDDSYTVVENHQLTVADPGVMANDVGADPSSIEYDFESVQLGTVNDDGYGAFDYTPPRNFTGVDSFTYTVWDYDVDNAYTATVTLHVVAPTPPPPPPPPKPPKPKGYWMAGATGQVYPFGQVRNSGDAHTVGVTHVEPTPSRLGYWVVNGAGQVFAFGDALRYGNAPALEPGEIVTSLSSTPSGKGYWLFTNRGRVVNHGDARFLGDANKLTLNGPIVGSAATPSGNGYYLVGSDGGIFTFGDARFFGSMGAGKLNKPVNGIVPTPDNRGYWLVASDGGIFAFGNATFHGSMGGSHLNRPIIGMVPYGNGYLMVSSDGGIFAFSNLPFLGSLGGNPPAAPIVSVASGG